MSTAARRWLRRPPASYRAGRVLARLGADLAGHPLEYRLERLSPSHARCVPTGPGPVFDARERTERHAFMGVTKTVFSCRLEGAGLGDPPGEPRLRLRHTGAVRRRGIAVRPGGEAADALLADRALAAALLPLDFRWFELSRDSDGWLAETELMGASEVAMRLPPTRSYVPLSPDQRDALVATFAALTRLPAGA